MLCCKTAVGDLLHSSNDIACKIHKRGCWLMIYLLALFNRRIVHCVCLRVYTFKCSFHAVYFLLTRPTNVIWALVFVAALERKSPTFSQFHKEILKKKTIFVNFVVAFFNFRLERKWFNPHKEGGKNHHQLASLLSSALYFIFVIISISFAFFILLNDSWQAINPCTMGW